MIYVNNIKRATITVGIDATEQEEKSLAGDIENFLLKKGFVCEWQVI
jgi:hypothetical protein